MVAATIDGCHKSMAVYSSRSASASVPLVRKSISVHLIHLKSFALLISNHNRYLSALISSTLMMDPTSKNSGSGRRATEIGRKSQSAFISKSTKVRLSFSTSVISRYFLCLEASEGVSFSTFSCQR